MKKHVSFPQTIFYLGLLISLFCVGYATFVSPRYFVVFWRLIRWYDIPVSFIMLIIMLGSFAYWRISSNKASPADFSKNILLRIQFRFSWILVLLWVVLCISSLVAYKNHPLSMDEYAPFFQAKIFASGKLHGSFPVEWLNYLIPPENQNYFLYANSETGAVTSKYWPGFAILLTPFMLLGIPWACNPTIVCLSLWMMVKITQKLNPNTSAIPWVILFAIASPVFLINGISYYSMSAHLLFNLLFTYFALLSSPKHYLLAGIFGGFAMTLHNPIPHIVFALPWIFQLLLKRSRAIFYLALGYIPVFGFLGVGW